MQKPADAAESAAEAIRALNHLTLGGQGFQYPSDAYDTLSSLVTLLRRLPQALKQIDSYVWEGAKGLRIAATYGTYNGRLMDAADAINDSLVRACEGLEQVTQEVETAFNAAAGLSAV